MHHVELAVHLCFDDAACASLYNRLALHQLCVVDVARPETDAVQFAVDAVGGIAVEHTVVVVEGREDMVAVDGLVVDARRDEFQQRGHRAAVVRDGGVVHLPTVVQFAVFLEGEAAVLLADEGSLSACYRIHRRHAPQREVALVCLIEVLDVDVALKSLYALCVVLGVGEQLTQQ